MATEPNELDDTRPRADSGSGRHWTLREKYRYAMLQVVVPAFFTMVVGIVVAVIPAWAASDKADKAELRATQAAVAVESKNAPIISCGAVSVKKINEDGNLARFDVAGLAGRTVVITGSAFGTVESATGLRIEILVDGNTAAEDWDMRAPGLAKETRIGASATYAFLAKDEKIVTVHVSDEGGRARILETSASCLAFAVGAK